MIGVFDREGRKGENQTRVLERRESEKRKKEKIHKRKTGDKKIRKNKGDNMTKKK